MNIRKIRFIDLINPLKWRAVLVSLLKRGKGVNLDFCLDVVRLSNKFGNGFANRFARTKGEELWYCELVVYRSMICSSCVKAGNCYHCGCSVPDNMLDKGNFCSAGLWGPTPTRENWENYKKIYKIDLSHV
jgi:hypothetical protein